MPERISKCSFKCCVFRATQLLSMLFLPPLSWNKPEIPRARAWPFLFCQGELNPGVRASLCVLGCCQNCGTGFFPLWCLGPRLVRGLCPREAQMGTVLVYPSRNRGFHTSACSGVRHRLHVVSGAWLHRDFSSGILSKHSRSFFRTFFMTRQGVDVIRTWNPNEREWVTLSSGGVMGLQMPQSTYTKLGACGHRW